MTQTNRTEQAVRHEGSIFLVNAADVSSEKLGKGAEKTEVQYLIDDRHGSKRFALRLYTVRKGGHTPLDQHQYEHHVYVLKGVGLLHQSQDTGSTPKTIEAGDALFIPSNAIHQFSNVQNEPLVFLCVKGNPHLYTHEALSRKSDDPEPNYC